MVSFNQIAADIRTPGHFIEFDNSAAVQGLAGKPHKALLVGQRLSGGTVIAGIPTLVTQADAALGYFGARSILAAQARAFKANNPNTELWAIALDDVIAGTAATCTMTISGTATENGTVFLYCGDRRIQVPVASGDAAAAVAAAVVSAVNAITTLHVTAAATGAVVTFTFAHKGTLGNQFQLQMNFQAGEKLPAGITAVFTAMSGGATDPDLQDALTAIGDNQYDTIATALSDATNLGVLADELARRWGPDAQIEGHGFGAVRGSVGTMQAFGNALNSPHLTVMGCATSPTPPWVWSAAVAAVDAGEPDPARPRQTLPLRGVTAPFATEVLTRAERQTLLTDGISTFTVVTGTVQVERLISTYQLNGFGLPDTSYLDITTLRTLAYLRFAVRVRISSKYPRHKLASDGTNFSPGQAVVTPSVIKAELFALFREWELAGLVEGWEAFKESIIVERDASNPNRVNTRLKPDLMNQFMVFAGQIQFLL